MLAPQLKMMLCDRRLKTVACRESALVIYPCTILFVHSDFQIRKWHTLLHRVSKAGENRTIWPSVDADL